MGKKKSIKGLVKLFKDFAIKIVQTLGSKTWFLTLLFFGAILLASVFVWWQCVYSPKPSPKVLQKIESEREDFDDMKKKTMEAITLLQGYRENYNDSAKFENQRELFIDLLDEEVKQKLEDAKNIEEGVEGESEGEDEIQVIDLDKKDDLGEDKQAQPTEEVQEIR